MALSVHKAVAAIDLRNISFAASGPVSYLACLHAKPDKATRLAQSHVPHKVGLQPGILRPPWWDVACVQAASHDFSCAAHAITSLLYEESSACQLRLKAIDEQGEAHVSQAFCTQEFECGWCTRECRLASS
jgi:hypothetical protein